MLNNIIMENTFPLEEKSIERIYWGNQETMTYIVPVYQRNYAWEEDEITALIKDVYDSLHKDENAPYYIGTLVTYEREDGECEEVVDGQQRLTTIYLILKVLGFKDIRNKLTYSARKVSASTIEKLNHYPDLGEDVDNEIRNGYKYVEKNINSVLDKSELEKFKEYFLTKVHIIHYRVPKDVDLNHYFEVMNSRGEQLEKHEIVKSILMNPHYLKEQKERATFSHIWEACSEMNIYIQRTFLNKKNNKEIFGNNLDKFKISGFKEILGQYEHEEGKKTIMTLLREPVKKIEGDTVIEQNDKFQPIVDFPNFLLIVLKLTRMESKGFNPIEFTLDDKELLNEFNKALKSVSNDNDRANFTRKFAFNLLKAKFFLDNYIVHHSLSDTELLGDNPWKLQCYHSGDSKRNGNLKNLSDNKGVQEELIHLLSMFEVSFTPKQRKNYLFYCLMHLFFYNNTESTEYRNFLRALAKKYFLDVYLNAECLNERNQPRPNAFDNALLVNGKLQTEIRGNETDYRNAFEEIYKQGKSDIPLFVFNYTDYRLWAKYAKTLRGNKAKEGSRERKKFFAELGCSDFGLDSFKKFYFSRTRRSLEHYYPRAKAVKDEIVSEDKLGESQINCFGNFAMIGAEANSSGSNWNPKAKLDHYTDGKSNPISVASLKFKIMMQTCKDNQKAKRTEGMEWNAEDIQKHQEKMLDIIFGIKKLF